MRNTTPENDPSRNGLVIQPAAKPQTIREYLASSSNAAFNEQVKAACAQRGISLDSPWSTKLNVEAVAEPASAQASKSARRRNSLLILPEERLTADELRQRMAEREAAKQKPDAVEYQHSLLCALTLPRSRQEGREYVREWQGRSLKLIAGELWNGTKWIPQPLPYGPKARLGFMHICTEAVKTQSRFIETEGSARAFMDRVGIGDDGRSYRLFRQQMNALAATSLRCGYTKDDGKAVTFAAQIIEQFEAWLTHDDGQPALWSSNLILGETFYQDLIKHAVPLSANALRGLSNSALALDWYGFFAYRLHTLEKPLFLSWRMLHAQLGQEYADAKEFKKKSAPAIKAVLAVYPSARVEFVYGGLMLYPSPPPIARQCVGVLPSRADKVKADLPPLAPALPAPPAAPAHRLHYKTIEKFKALYPRKDVYACEADFRYWLENSTKAKEPKNYDAAFLGFAKRWVTSG